MLHANDPIVAALKAARLEKGLSQRALGERAGVPQSHISKIEAGAVDMQLSSLLALARALDLDVMTVPRALMPAVEGIVRGNASKETQQFDNVRRTAKLLDGIIRSVNRLRLVVGNAPALDTLRRSAQELENFRLKSEDIDAIASIDRALKQVSATSGDPGKIPAAAAALRALRNRLAHAGFEMNEPIRPAYTLDDDA